MNILNVTTIDTGGAYKAVIRIQESLRTYNIHSSILLRNKTKEGSEGEAYLESECKTFFSKLKNFCNLLISHRELIVYEKLGSDISQNKLVRDADVIILHWINSFISIEKLEKLLNLKKPIIWVMHDMWPMTGGCHYDEYCGRFAQSCGNCPLLRRGHPKDITKKQHMLKEQVYNENNFYVIGPSRWMVDMAHQSSLMKNKKIFYVPNTINIQKFYPRDKQRVIQKYQLPIDKKIILFGADNAGTDNKVKGFSYLLKALELINTDEYFLVIFGNANEKTLKKIHHNYKNLGYISDEEEMAEIYSAADVMVTPSIQEAFGYTACESLACGTPVAAFKIGGFLDQIEHKLNGYLADFNDTDDLAKGICYCVQNTNIMGEKAVKMAQRFSYEKVGKNYIDVINSIYSTYKNNL